MINSHQKNRSGMGNQSIYHQAPIHQNVGTTNDPLVHYNPQCCPCPCPCNDSPVAELEEQLRFLRRYYR